MFEGLIIGTFGQDERTVVASLDSDFFNHLGCTANTTQCEGTVVDFVDSFFGGKFSGDNFAQDIIVLSFFLIAARIATFFALKYCKYTST